MRNLMTVRRMVIVVALTMGWCGLWRDLSVANVVAGTLIAVGLVVSGVGTAGRGGVRLRPLVHLVWLVLVDLVRSTGSVAAEIVTPADRTEEAIIAVELPAGNREHLLLVVAITLTPGTAVVDADPDTGTLYLHLLHHDRRDSTLAHVERLSRLSSDALPLVPIQGGSS